MAESGIYGSVENEFNKASMAVDKKNYAYAIELLSHVISIKPDFVRARQLLLIARIRAFEATPPNPVLKVFIGISSFIRSLRAAVRETKGEDQKAMSIYEAALAKDPKNVRLLTRLGALLKIEGMNEAAAVTLEIALKISAKNSEALGILGDIYSGMGKYDRARACYKKVLNLKPQDAAAERGLKNLDALTTIDTL